MFSNIHHVAVICSNYERSKKFYTDILGFQIFNEQYRVDKKSWKCDMKNGAVQLELFTFLESPQRSSYPEALGLRHLAFREEDIENVCTYLRTKGIPTEPIRVDAKTGKKYTFFCDPDNLPIEIYEEKKANIS